MIIKGPETKSSFLSMEKDLNIIITKMLNNDRLKRLLYYNTPDCLRKPNLTEVQSQSLIGKNIKIVPKLEIDSELVNYVIVNFDNFVPSGNPEFRDNTVIFDIVCNFNQWQLEDMQLRPYKIAGEIDSMFDNTHLSGIGTFQFLGSSEIILNDQLGGLMLMYTAVHGGEDKKHMQTEEQNEIFFNDFNNMKNK